MFKIVSALLALALTAGCSSTATFPLTSEHKSLYSPAMEKDMAYSVYTPPGWRSDEQLPLLVLLHGASDDQRTFDKHEVGQYLDAQIVAGELPRVIVLNPNGDLGFWEDWYDGSRNYRSWVVSDLMPRVARDYNTLACPQNCFVTGISMGAHGAIRFAYFEPELFSSVAAISGRIVSRDEARNSSSVKMAIMEMMIPMKRIWGDLDGDHIPADSDPYVAWLEKPEMQDIRLMLSWGTQEDKAIVASNQRFQSYLQQNRRPHKKIVYNGGHRWADWKAIIAESIRFHMQQDSAELATR